MKVTVKVLVKICYTPVYLGQIDEKLGTFCAGKKEFRLFQNVFFEDQDGVLVLQSLLERKDVPNSEDGESIRPGAAAATSAAASTSGPSAAATGTGESPEETRFFSLLLMPLLISSSDGYKKTTPRILGARWSITAWIIS